MIKIVSILFFLNSCCIAQSIHWQKTFGGIYAEEGSCVLPIDNGNLLFCGYAESNDGDVVAHIGVAGTPDCWLLKTDSLGNILDSKCFGGMTTDYSYSIIKCFNNGYLMNAYSTSRDGDVTGMHDNGPDIWLVKLDDQFSIEWESAFGSYLLEEYGTTIQTPDSGFVTIVKTEGDDGDVSGNHGLSFGDIWVFKIDKNGALLWQTCLGGSLTEFPGSLLNTNDNGFIICGTVANGFGGNVNCVPPFAGENIWVVKLDSLGQIQWDKCYGSSGNDKGVDIVTSPNGGFYVLGHSANNDGDVTQFYGMVDNWLLRIDDFGNLIWDKSFGGAGIEFPSSLVLSAGGDLIMCGLTNSTNGMAASNHGSNDVFIVRTDSSGNLLWSQCYGGTDSDIGNSIEISTDGFPVFTGTTASSNGDITFNHGSTDLWVVKLSDSPINVRELNISFLNVSGKIENGRVKVGFNAKVAENLTIELTDILGRTLLSEPVKSIPGRNEYEFFSTTTCLIYFLQLKTNTEFISVKIF